MSQPTQQRPPQVSLASGIVMFSSVLVLLTAWERIAGIGSLETQESISSLLADAPFSSLGLDVQSASGLLYWSCVVAALCACATAVLGWYVRKPDRSSRLALTIFAVPVFVTGLPAGGLAGSFVAAGAVMLWVAPAREWFATGRWTPPSPAREAAAERRTTPAEQNRPAEHGSLVPPPADRPFGQPVPPVAGQPASQQSTQQSAQQSAQQPAAWQQRQLLHARPGAVVAAFVLTVITAGGLLVLSLLWVAMAGLSPDFLMSVLEQQQPDLLAGGVTMEEVRSTVFAFAGAFIVWSVVALVFAGYVMARRDWARRGLMVTAALSAGGSLAFIGSLPLVVLPAAAAVATVVCLRRIEVRRWFSLEPH